MDTVPELALWYRFAEGKGTTLQDHSGQRRHGQIRGAQWRELGDGFALEFDGRDDSVLCSGDGVLPLGKALTIETWVYPVPLRDHGEPAIVAKGKSEYLLSYGRGSFRWRVFRARTDRAKLLISDWPEGKRPGRHPNQKLMCNFVEVQPYLEE